MSRALGWLAERRSALLIAAVTAAAVLAPHVYAGEQVGTRLVLAALAAAIGAYVVACEAIGRLEKAAAGAVVAGLAALVSALDLDLNPTGVGLFVVLAVAAELGLVPALPSTTGSAAQVVPGEVVAASSRRV